MAYSVANTVYRHRTFAGMTQEELAERAGVSRQTVIAIEKGNYTPSVLLALRIARTFRVPVEDLFELVHAN
jgi:putative transcriptional regulator